ncbi:LacI family transcriptional regulator [Serratia marcescens]|nr:LacI family transcriptional regulator [Serratia marcescens]
MVKSQRITLNDIAVLAGVTKMTVSRYLRTPDRVKPETAARIAAVIEEVGYQADPDNPALYSNSPPLIGVLVPSFNNLIFADVLAGIESVASIHGYQTLVVNYDYNSKREEEQIAAILAFKIKGLLLTESVHSLRAEKFLKTAKIPVAEIMGLSGNADRINVGFDNVKAGYDMTTMLLASGKKRIIYFGSMSDIRDEQRYTGYCQAMANHDLPTGRISPNKISSISIGTGMMTLASQMYPDMDGILCTNDDLAVGVLQECLANGISVPAQIAIAGFHGLEIGQIITPRLASVLTPRYEMGKVATEIIIKKIKGLPTIERVDLHFRLSMGETI